jgi:hypothetical protein
MHSTSPATTEALSLDCALVSVSNSCQNFVPSSLFFTYATPPAVISAQPRSGPIRGGTYLRVISSRIPEAIVRCCFGSTYLVAQLLQAEIFVCATPSNQAEGAQTVTILLDDLQVYKLPFSSYGTSVCSRSLLYVDSPQVAQTPGEHRSGLREAGLHFRMY